MQQELETASNVVQSIQIEAADREARLRTDPALEGSLLAQKSKRRAAEDEIRRRLNSRPDDQAAEGAVAAAGLRRVGTGDRAGQLVPPRGPTGWVNGVPGDTLELRCDGTFSLDGVSDHAGSRGISGAWWTEAGRILLTTEEIRTGAGYDAPSGPSAPTAWPGRDRPVRPS